MRTRRWTAAFIAVAGLAALGGGLVGCAQPTPVPPPPTADDIAAVREAWAQDWWDSLATGTTMPDVDVIAELPMEKAWAEQSKCLEAAQIPGLTVRGPQEWQFDSSTGDARDAANAQTQWFVCVQQYPVAGDTESILSPAQLDWLYNAYRERYLPCLRSFGVEPMAFPASRDQFLEGSRGYPAWVPFEGTLSPTMTSEQWQRVAQRCPLPDVLQEFPLPGYPD
jgi:hypothetical protein